MPVAPVFYYLKGTEMAKKLLTEFFELCKDGICQDLLTEREKKEVSEGAMYLSGRMQTCEKRNGNGRVYPCKTLRREIARYQATIKDNRALGELDHPDDSVINLRNASHMVVNMWWEGNDVMGKLKILNTPSGRILRELTESGVKLGISSRGLGSVKESMGNTIVQEDFELICFDIVSEPSTPNAFIYPETKPVSISMYESKIKQKKDLIIEDLFDKILRD